MRKIRWLRERVSSEHKSTISSTISQRQYTAMQADAWGQCSVFAVPERHPGIRERYRHRCTGRLIQPDPFPLNETRPATENKGMHLGVHESG